MDNLQPFICTACGLILCYTLYISESIKDILAQILWKTIYKDSCLWVDIETKLCINIVTYQ